MKKIDIGQTIGILGNLGVIVGIAFLAYELRQNQLVGRAQTRNEIATAHRELSQFDIAGPILSIRSMALAGEPLSELQQDQLDVWSQMWLRHFENLHYQYRQNLFDPDEFEAMMRGIEGELNEELFVKDTFCRNRPVLSPSFVAELESRLATPCE